MHFLKLICLCKKRTNTRLAILTNPRRRAKRLFFISNEHQTSVHRKNDCPQIHSSSPFGYGVAILTKENAAADTQTVSHPQSPKAGRCWTESPQKAGRTKQCDQQRKDQQHTEKFTQHSEKKLQKKQSCNCGAAAPFRIVMHWSHAQCRFVLCSMSPAASS